MSPQNRPLIVGLAAPGLLWLATSVAFGQDPPPAPPGPSTPAPTSLSRTYQALLLSNGKVVNGEIVEDAVAGTYRLRGHGGMVPYPRSMVLKAAGSIEELYQFQVARLPDGDPDERMKLARWCLTEKLRPQAKEQLEAIQAMCPNDAEAKRMLYNLASTNGQAQVDAGVRLTSGEMTRDDAPASLDHRVVKKAQQRFNALPEILDLPRAQAVKKANEFADYVQPVLQQSCARCHNEKYQGDFQLVEIKVKRDLTNSDIARANLDATLRLINPDDPARSELLSAGLVPHGGSKNAIFRGPNDRNYQVLATWAKSLKAAKAGTRGDGVARTGYTSPDNAPGDGFAADRADRPGSPIGAPSGFQPAGPRGGPPPVPGVDFARQAAAANPLPPPRAIVEQMDASAVYVNSPGENPEFPTPYVPGGGGPIPRPGPVPPRPRAGSAAAPKAMAPIPTPSTPTAATKTATQVGPNAVVVGPTDDPNQLPGMDQPHYPPKSETDPDAKKVKKIDNALLEKMMRNRNGGTP